MARYNETSSWNIRTEWTFERLFSSVLSLVLYEITLQACCIGTVLTFEGSLCTVRFLVSYKMRFVRSFVWAFRTFKGLFARVDSLVCHKVALVRAYIRALWAFEQVIFAQDAVDFFMMCRDVRFASRAIVAVRTFVWFLACVSQLMRWKPRLNCGCIWALSTLIPLLVTVNALVSK